MPRTPKLVRSINGLLEMCWLFVIVAVPIFFNVDTIASSSPTKRRCYATSCSSWRFCSWPRPYTWRHNTLPSGPPRLKARRHARFQGMLHRASATPNGNRRASFRVYICYCVYPRILPTISFWGSYDRMERCVDAPHLHHSFF